MRASESWLLFWLLGFDSPPRPPLVPLPRASGAARPLAPLPRPPVPDALMGRLASPEPTAAEQLLRWFELAAAADDLPLPLFSTLPCPPLPPAPFAAVLAEPAPAALAAAALAAQLTCAGAAAGAATAEGIVASGCCSVIFLYSLNPPLDPPLLPLPLLLIPTEAMESTIGSMVGILRAVPPSRPLLPPAPPLPSPRFGRPPGGEMLPLPMVAGAAPLTLPSAAPSCLPLALFFFEFFFLSLAVKSL